VELLGARTSDEVRDLLRDADALVLPSVPTADGRREGIPIVLMEAMSSGLAVVASRMAGIPELVEDRVGGLLVEPGDTAALADALMELARDPDLRDRLGRRGGLACWRSSTSTPRRAGLASEFEDVVDVRRAAHREGERRDGRCGMKLARVVFVAAGRPAGLDVRRSSPRCCCCAAGSGPPVRDRRHRADRQRDRRRPR
jgi:glycosyltransferase involved in cell wall biosynthesis